jgi:hypothetical protein
MTSSLTLGIRNSFNLPKLHFALHHTHMIRTYGTTDSYNTKYTERLHIDLAKDAYRSTNHKNECAQMATWLERREKILRHDKYIQWKLGGAYYLVMFGLVQFQQFLLHSPSASDHLADIACNGRWHTGVLWKYCAGEEGFILYTGKASRLYGLGEKTEVLCTPTCQTETPPCRRQGATAYLLWFV